MNSHLISAIVPVSLLSGWELGSAVGAIDETTFSRPSAILRAGAIAGADGSLVTATYQTLEAASLGLFAGTLIGVTLGIFLGLQRLVELASRPTLEMLRAIPAIAFTPLALLIFGFGLTMESAIVAYATCWPVMIATLAATRRIEPRLLEVAATLEMTAIERLWTIIIPAVFGRVVVGLRIAIGFALVVAVTVEILVNPRGLGYALILAQQTFRTDLMYALIVWLAVLGMIAGALSSQLDRLSVPRSS